MPWTSRQEHRLRIAATYVNYVPSTPPGNRTTDYGASSPMAAWLAPKKFSFGLVVDWLVIGRKIILAFSGAHTTHTNLFAPAQVRKHNLCISQTNLEIRTKACRYTSLSGLALAVNPPARHVKPAAMGAYQISFAVSRLALRLAPFGPHKVDPPRCQSRAHLLSPTPPGPANPHCCCST